MNKKELVEKMTEERNLWNRIIKEILNQSKGEEVISKNWILKDVIMHMYIYELEIKNALQTRALKQHHFWAIPYSKRNAEIYTKRDDYTLEKIFTLDKENFDLLVQEVQKLQDEDITSQKFFSDSRRTVQSLIKGNSYGHYHEHIPKLKKRFNLT